MHIFFLIAAIALLPIFLARMRVVWGWVNLLFLAAAFCWVTLHLVPASEKELGWAIGVALLAGLNVLIVASLGVRLLICWVTQAPWHPDGRPNLIGNALHAGNGIFVALVIFGMFASRLEGTDYVGIAHIGLICAALVVMSFGKPGRNSALYHWSIACGLMVLTIASALCPVAVRASASQQAAGARYCIYLNHSRHFALDARDLMFLGWHRGSGDAHATLIIMGEDGPIYGNWSFRQRAFMVPWDVRGHPPTLTCPH